MIALVLAVVIGPQTRAWSWGPALVPLGLALLAAIPPLVRRNGPRTDIWVACVGLLVTGWFAWRAWVSPVEEFALADLLLLASAVGSFLVMRTIQGNPAAERVLLWGIALLLLASVAVVAKQIGDPSFSPFFSSRPQAWPSGFFAHYNEGANFLIGSSLVLGAAACVGLQGRAERAIWGLIALAGLAAVYFTHSRGGILGVAVGSSVFFAVALMIGKRRGAGWFAPALIGIPVIGLALGIFLYHGWSDAQAVRLQTISALGDNTVRLVLMGIAVSTIAEHPWAGGGSRSFSWEVLQHWETDLHGWGRARPEQVHNELLQAATDYGLAGAVLVGGFMIALVIAGLGRSIFSGNEERFGMGDAWRLGGIAGLAGMFVQSSFSFVFHLLPGTILLGLCLGRAAGGLAKTGGSGALTNRLPGFAMAAVCLLLAAGLLPVGWAASRTTESLRAIYFSKAPASPAARLTALSEAIRRWPTAELLRERAMLMQEIAAADVPEFSSEEATRLALDDYTEALDRHPFDATSSINRANLLSSSRRTAEADEEFARAIRLQGGLEPAFRARVHFARHLVRKGRSLMSVGNYAPAVDAFQQARAEIEIVGEEFPQLIDWGEGLDLQLTILEGLGAAQEGMEDFPAAADAYLAASKFHQGRRAHFYLGALFTRIGEKAWTSRKPSDAFAYFLKAREHFGTASELPEGVTAELKQELVDYIDRSIALLTETKFVPTELPER